MKRFFAVASVLLAGMTTSVFASWWDPLSWFNSREIKQVSNMSTKSTSIGLSSDLISEIVKATNSTTEKGGQKTKKQNTSRVVQPATYVSPTTKTCLNGSIVSINDYCTKVCPNGEIVLETLSCKNDTSAMSSILCNGINWQPCPEGQNFICPGNGGKAYCQTKEQVQLARQTQEEISLLDNQLNKLLFEQQSCLDEQQISDLGQKGAGLIAGELTSGTSPVGEGNAAIAAQAQAYELKCNHISETINILQNQKNILQKNF